MLVQQQEALQARSVQGSTNVDSLDLSSMYEGHDQHAHQYRDTTSSSALHSELSASESPQEGEDDVTLHEERSVDDDTSTQGDDVSLSSDVCSTAPQVVSDDNVPNHLELGHTPYHKKDVKLANALNASKMREIASMHDLQLDFLSHEDLCRAFFKLVARPKVLPRVERKVMVPEVGEAAPKRKRSPRTPPPNAPIPP